MLLKHICETYGIIEVLDSETGFKGGWDYPPKTCEFGIISPRTCPYCSIDTTLWWELVVKKMPIESLCSRHQATMQRILNEPSNILVDKKGSDLE